MSQIEYPELMTPMEVASLFHVDPKTVTRWARAGKLASIRTPGGHRRYIAFEARAVLRGLPLTAEQEATLRYLGGRS